MPGRSYLPSFGGAGGGRYRYGFNGKENDNEAKGSGNQQDYGFRIYDSRLGKFLSVDPLTREYPWYTPYQFAGNKPIRFIDRDGAEEDDPDKYLNSLVPKIELAFKSNILKLPTEQQAAMRRNVSHAFAKRWQFENNFVSRWLSTRLMTRWMEGLGGYDILSYKTIKNSVYLSWLQFDRGRDAITDKLKSLTLDYAKTLKPGSYNFSAASQFDVGQGGSALTDIGTGLGSFKLLGKSEAYISKAEDGSISMTMGAYYTLADKYQWKKGKGTAVEEFVDHDKMLQLEKIGAKPFYIRVYFEATYKYSNGEFTRVGDFTDSKADWYMESDEIGNMRRGVLKNPEPAANNGYAIPSSEKKKIYDHRE